MRTLALVIATVFVAGLVVGLVYALGVSQRGDIASGTSPVVEAQPSPQSGSTWPGGEDAAPLVAADAVAPPADPRSPLAIQIPGCVCHSKDPKLVKRHETYRMNQCAGCHVGGPPTGQK